MNDATPRRPRGRVLAIAAATIAIVIAATGVALVLLLPDNSDQGKIHALIGKFSDAVSSGDPAAMAQYMCAVEKSTFEDNTDPSPGPPIRTPKRSFQVSALDIRSGAASATLTFPNAGTQTLYFLEESGRWTVCAPARDRLLNSPSVTPHPTADPEFYRHGR